MKDIVFIDTSVFIRENYFSKGNRINTLIQIHNSGLLDFVSTEITITELLKHLREDTEQSYKAIINSNAELERKGIKSPININLEFDAHKSTKSIVDNFIGKTSTYVIRYNELTSIKEIFDNYFLQKPPFQGKSKKHEFPDAFVLRLLEVYCEHKGLHKIIVLSADNDMKEYESPYLEYRDYKSYITEKSAQKETLDEIHYHLEAEQEKCISDIKDKLSNVLQDDETIYYNVLSSAEINDINVKGIDVDLDIEEYSIKEQTEDYYILEIPVTLSYSVEVEYVDYDYAWYDKEDDRWYNEELANDIVTNNRRTTILLKYYKVNATRQQPYITIEDYNIEEALVGMR